MKYLEQNYTKKVICCFSEIQILLGFLKTLDQKEVYSENSKESSEGLLKDHRQEAHNLGCTTYTADTQ